MTANDMTTRDAAQTGALPKSAVWSRSQSHRSVEGGAGARSLTSEHTNHTSSPATSGGRPKRPPLPQAEKACEEVRSKTMNTHTTHELAAGVAHTGGSGGGRAVWQEELPCGVETTRRTAADRGMVAGRPPRPDEFLRCAGRAVLVTACAGGADRRGGRPVGVHPSGRTREAGARGWTPTRRSPLPAHTTTRVERRGGLPTGIHPCRLDFAPRPGAAGWTSTSDVRPAFLSSFHTRHGAAGRTPTLDVRPAALPLAPEDRFGVCEQHPLPLALRPQTFDLVAQDLDVLQRLEGGNQTFLLRAVLPRRREEQELLVGVDVEVHLPARTPARTAAAPRLLTGRRLLRWVTGQGGLRRRGLGELHGNGLDMLARRSLIHDVLFDRPRLRRRLNWLNGRDCRRHRRSLRRDRRRRLDLFDSRRRRIVGEVFVGVGRPRDDAALVPALESELPVLVELVALARLLRPRIGFGLVSLESVHCRTEALRPARASIA